MTKTNAKQPGKTDDPTERRRSRRRPILDSFSLFLVIPKKGPHRLPIHDVSKEGIGFSLDTEGEAPETFPLEVSETLQLRLYLNQTLYLPLTMTAVRIERVGNVRRAGATFEDRASKSYKAYVSFHQMLDDFVEAAHLDPSSF
jgi:hypothetical protein